MKSIPSNPNWSTQIECQRRDLDILTIVESIRNRDMTILSAMEDIRIEVFISEYVYQRRMQTSDFS